MISDQRKEVILEKLAIKGTVLRAPKDAAAYLASKIPGGSGSNPMSWRKMLQGNETRHLHVRTAR